MRALLFLLLPFFRDSTNKVEIKSVYNSNFNLVIESKYKLKLDTATRYFPGECGIGKRKLYYARIINKKKRTEILDIYVLDTLDYWYKYNDVIVDSCFKNIDVDCRKAKLCKYTFRDFNCLTAQIQCESKILQVTFKENCLDFAEEILYSMKIIEY